MLCTHAHVINTFVQATHKTHRHKEKLIIFIPKIIKLDCNNPSAILCFYVLMKIDEIRFLYIFQNYYPENKRVKRLTDGNVLLQGTNIIHILLSTI